MSKEKETFAFGDGVSTGETPFFQLKLFITGASPNSLRAIENLRIICNKHFNANKYELEIIDVYQQPSEAKGMQIVALPMLLKSRPLPVRRLIGDLSDTSKVLKGLGLKSE